MLKDIICCVDFFCEIIQKRREKEMNYIIQTILFASIGVIIGAFGTLLFFRFDKAWKQILLGLGSAISTGGVGIGLVSYLKIEQECMLNLKIVN